jgi:hypothetical protein
MRTYHIEAKDSSDQLKGLFENSLIRHAAIRVTGTLCFTTHQNVHTYVVTTKPRWEWQGSDSQALCHQQWQR